MINQVPSRGSENFGNLSQDEQKKLLLEHYSERPSTQFGQLDGFVIGVGKGDSVMRPDDDGDWCSGGCTHELMHGADVRILIKKGTSYKDAIRLITKLLEWFKSDYAGSAAYALWQESQELLSTQGTVYVTAKGKLQPRPEIAVAKTAGEMMQTFATELGLTPTSRARMNSPKANEEIDPMEELLQEIEKERKL